MQIREREVVYLIKLREVDSLKKAVPFFLNRKAIIYTASGKPVMPKTFTQQEYVNTIDKDELIFGVGPAGTGKTYLAVAMAVKYLKQNKVKKLILTRPAVEAGEYLGFLPGDLKEKIDPYLRPLYDALYEFLGYESTNNLLETGVIEIAPLAYIEENLGTSLHYFRWGSKHHKYANEDVFNSFRFFIKDGYYRRPKSNRLTKGQKSGLKEALSLLKDIKQIKTVKFERLDVVRNPLVQKILEKYEHDES